MPEKPALLPDEFADLERFAADWVLPTERERYAKRLSSSMDQMQAFYDAAFARAKPAIKYLTSSNWTTSPSRPRTCCFCSIRWSWSRSPSRPENSRTCPMRAPLISTSSTSRCLEDAPAA
jgi:hypothetical protein